MKCCICHKIAEYVWDGKSLCKECEKEWRKFTLKLHGIK